MLESMSSTVSFQELLGHCNELYKINQTDMVQLEDRLKSYGYVPGIFKNSNSVTIFFFCLVVIFCLNFDCNSFRFMDLALDIAEEDEVSEMYSQVSDDKLDSLSSFYRSLSVADPVADSGFKNYEDDDLYPYLMEFIQF